MSCFENQSCGCVMLDLGCEACKLYNVLAEIYWVVVEAIKLKGIFYDYTLAQFAS